MPRSGNLPLPPVSGCVIGAQAPLPTPCLSGVRDGSEVTPRHTHPTAPCPGDLSPPGYLFSQPLELKVLVTLCLTGQGEAAALLALGGCGAHPDFRHIWGRSNRVRQDRAGQIPSRPSLVPLSWAPSPSQFTTSSCWSLSSDAVLSKSRP